LDGEIWGGRRQFQKTVGIVKSSARSKEWEFLTYMVFDCVEEGGVPIEHRPFEERLASVKSICTSSGSDALQAVPMQKCRGRDHLSELLVDIESRGGEGLMLRRPQSAYERRRSKALLKVKTFHDEEAIVVGHETGKGRLASLCGALLCETPDKRRFKVGSGLNDAQRHDPPQVGSVITYRYQELTNANIPRFPTLAAERVDLDWKTICASYVPPAKRIESALQKNHSVLFGDAGAHESASASAKSAAGQSSSAPPKFRRSLSAEDAAQRGAAVEDLEDLAGALSDEERAVAAKRPRIDKRPICIYGSKCYRSNPEHFVEFAHPWLDEENGDTRPVAAASSAAAKSQAMEISSAIPEAVVTQASNRDAAARGVRIMALRSLLNSLVVDSASDSERSHFQRLLEILETGPTTSEPALKSSIDEKPGEALPPLPPPDVPPPLVDARPLLEPAPTIAAMPEEVAKVVTPLVTASSHTSRLASELLSTESDVDKIMDLGFSAADATESLKHGNSIQAAIEWLLAKAG
jgi:hypothetical protein